MDPTTLTRLAGETPDPFTIDPLVAVAIVFGTALLIHLIREGLIQDRRVALIDLTNDTRTLTDYSTPLAERDRAANRLPDRIRTVHALTHGLLADTLFIADATEQRHADELTDTARRALARHRTRYPAA